MKIVKYLLTFIGLLWLYFWFAYPSYTWHQKVTLEIETPQGLVSGSSVTRVKYQSHMQFFGMGPVRSIRTKGEVPVVDLGNGNYVFALIFEDDWFPVKAFEPVISDRKKLTASNVYNYSGPAFQIKLKHYPLLVTFNDINDPKTVREVNPNDLVATLGKGYVLKSVTMETTDDALTNSKVESVLEWLVHHKGRIKPYVGPTRNLGDVPTVELLTKQNFLKEEK